MSQPLSQDELKTQVAQAAVAHIAPQCHAGQIIGVGTGSTVNKFIDALVAKIKVDELQIAGAVSSSNASTERLVAHGIKVYDAQDVQRLSVYVDGADEIDHSGYMIKGGGAALTREKIIAAMSERFVCIADESKLVKTLGAFPLPVEVIPMAANQIAKRFVEKFGKAGNVVASIRLKDGAPLVTDNSGHILDVTGLQIKEPLPFELGVNQWAGVVTVGVFAQQRAHVCLLATANGVKNLAF